MKIRYLFLSFIILLLTFNISEARWITICSNSHNHKEFTHKHKHKHKYHKHNHKHKIIKRKNRKHFIKREFPVNIPSMVSSDIQHPLKNLIVNNSTTIYNEPFVYIDIFVDINRPVFFGLYGNGGYSDKVLSKDLPKYSYGLKDKDKDKDKEPETYLEKYKRYHNIIFDYNIVYGRNNKEIPNSWDHILSSVLSYSSDNGFLKQFNEKELVCKSIWIPEPPNYPPVPEPSSILLFISGLFIFFTYRKKFVDKV